MPWWATIIFVNTRGGILAANIPVVAGFCTYYKRFAFPPATLAHEEENRTKQTV